MTLKGWTILCGILGAAAAACSSAPAGSGKITPLEGAGGGSNGGDSSMAGNTGCIINCAAGGANGTAGGNGAGGIAEAEICGTAAVKQESVPVDMYIMFDQ